VQNPGPRGAAPAAWALTALTLTLTNAASLAGQSGGGEVASQECCLPLLLSIGARALSIGDAVSARSGPGSLFANPALIADVVHDQFLVHNANTTIDKQNTFTLLIHSDVAGSFALSYRLIDYGEQEARDPDGNLTGSVATLEQEVVATYATRVVPGVSAGVSYTLYQYRVDCRGFCNTEGFAATTHGIDLGLQVEPPSMRYLALGASIVHLGFPLQVVNREQASPLPLRVRTGAAYEVLHHFREDSTVAVWASTDIVTNPREGSVVVNVGAELSLEETIFLRAGYGSGRGIAGGAAVGVGLRYDRFDISVAKSFVSTPIDDSEPIQITFAIRF